MTDVAVVGGGLAGLSCAVELRRHGLDVVALERGDEPGGRIRTDVVPASRLDCGFQVLLTAYPEARRVLDDERAGLRPVYAARTWVGRDGRVSRVADPARHPFAAARSLTRGPGTMADKVRVARLRRRLSRLSLNEVLDAPQVTTAEALRREGFSAAIVEQFFRPYLGGIFLTTSL